MDEKIKYNMVDFIDKNLEKRIVTNVVDNGHFFLSEKNRLDENYKGDPNRLKLSNGFPINDQSNNLKYNFQRVSNAACELGMNIATLPELIAVENSFYGRVHPNGDRMGWGRTLVSSSQEHCIIDKKGIIGKTGEKLYMCSHGDNTLSSLETFRKIRFAGFDDYIVDGSEEREHQIFNLLPYGFGYTDEDVNIFLESLKENKSLQNIEELVKNGVNKSPLRDTTIWMPYKQAKNSEQGKNLDGCEGSLVRLARTAGHSKNYSLRWQPDSNILNFDEKPNISRGMVLSLDQNSIIPHNFRKNFIYRLIKK